MPNCEKYHNIKMVVCQPIIFLILVLKGNYYFCSRHTVGPKPDVQMAKKE